MVDLLKFFSIFSKWTIPSESTIKPTGNCFECCNVIIPNYQISLCILPMAESLGGGGVSIFSKWTIPSESTIKPTGNCFECCNVIIPNYQISLCILPMAESLGGGGGPRAFWYSISWQFEHFWANNWQGINNSHRTIKLWFTEEK